MKLKRLSILLTLLLLSHRSYSQHLSFHRKHLLRKELKQMSRDDQRYRGNNKINFLASDSLMLLQTNLDSINEIKLVSLINQYGYPSYERIKSSDAFVISLHLTYEKDFIQLENLFTSELKKGNMPPQEFGTWYDRCRQNMHLKPVYGCYGNKEFAESEKIEINKHRKKIGLKELE